MPKSINLEIIAHGPEQQAILPVSAHVRKYTERFIYTSKITDTTIPIAYYETSPIDAWKNIQIIDKTYRVAANHIEFVGDDITWTKIVGTSFSSRYKSIAITNKSIIDTHGKAKPLFFKHVLPKKTIEAEIHVITEGGKVDIETGLLKDLDHDMLYTNYQNFYNPDTGAYRIYYVTSVDIDGKATNELLSPVPAASEASWEDVDLDTGKIVGTVWTRERNTSGFTFYMYGDSTWYIKPLDTSCIRPLFPSGKTPTDSWFLRFTDGEFTTVLNNRVHRFFVPEYDLQPFAPSKPFVYLPSQKVLWVNRNTLVATRKYLAVDPALFRHLTIFMYDADFELAAVYTTDPVLGGTRYSDTEIFYESDKILDWDNTNGFFSMGIEVDPNFSFYASYFYEAHEYEYTGLTLNPLHSKDVLAKMWVFYIIPDVHFHDRAIHHLGIDQDGIIVSASQDLGRTYPNLQLLNDDGTFNPDTIIGMKYNSLTDSNNFTNLYTLPHFNEYQYYVLSEVVVMDIGDKEDSIVFDVRRDGAVIKKDHFEDTFRANPRILQSHLGCGDDGQVVPQNNMMLIRAPITLLEDYGGVLTPDKAEQLLTSYLPSADSGLVHWDYKMPELTGISSVAKMVNLYMTWEGPNLTYNIYRKLNPVGEWVLLTSIVNPAEGSVVYTDVNDLKSGYIYYYGVRVVENGIELPFGNKLGVMVM